MDADAVAIAERMRRADDRSHGDAFKAPHPAQGLLDLRGLDGQLALVSDVLVGAAAAAFKVRAGCRHAVRRRRFHLDQFRLAKVLLLPQDAGGDFFSRYGERDEVDLALGARHTLAAKGDVVNLKGQQAGWGHDKRKRLPPIRRKPSSKGKGRDYQSEEYSRE
jgi:hypothetical protein